MATDINISSDRNYTGADKCRQQSRVISKQKKEAVILSWKTNENLYKLQNTRHLFSKFDSSKDRR
jgi:hypothetical protein